MRDVTRQDLWVFLEAKGRGRIEDDARWVLYLDTSSRLFDLALSYLEIFRCPSRNCDPGANAKEEMMTPQFVFHAQWRQL